jgi:hypothetical protein
MQGSRRQEYWSADARGPRAQQASKLETRLLFSRSEGGTVARAGGNDCAPLSALLINRNDWVRLKYEMTDYWTGEGARAQEVHRSFLTIPPPSLPRPPPPGPVRIAPKTASLLVTFYSLPCRLPLRRHLPLQCFGKFAPKGCVLILKLDNGNSRHRSSSATYSRPSGLKMKPTRVTFLPLLIAQPKQVPAHDPNPLPKTNQDRIVRAEKLMSSHPRWTIDLGGSPTF